MHVGRVQVKGDEDVVAGLDGGGFGGDGGLEAVHDIAAANDVASGLVAEPGLEVERGGPVGAGVHRGGEGNTRIVGMVERNKASENLA